MSSYQVDPKTNMPILYLKDQKSELWKKFLQEYPNGMKKTSFIARLANGLFRYRENLSGCIQFVIHMVIKFLKIYRL